MALTTCLDVAALNPDNITPSAVENALSGSSRFLLPVIMSSSILARRRTVDCSIRWIISLSSLSVDFDPYSVE